MHSPPHYKLVCPHTSYQCGGRCILIHMFLMRYREHINFCSGSHNVFILLLLSLRFLYVFPLWCR